MNCKGPTIAVLLAFFSTLTGHSEPVRHQDIDSDSFWSAHLDITRLSDPALKGFIGQVTGFDRMIELKTTLKNELAIDLDLLKGVTLCGVENRPNEASLIIRGDFKTIDLTRLPILKDLPPHHNIPLRQGPDWQQSPLILARISDSEWAAGTSLLAVTNALDILAGRKKQTANAPLAPTVISELNSAAAMLALDMKKLNAELEFEADFTRSIQQSWFLIGSRGDQVVATLMINSSDAQGLAFIQSQFQMLPVLLIAQPNAPMTWLELAGAIAIETEGNLMTMKLAASPEKAALFLKSLAPFFVQSPKPVSEGN